MEKIYLKLESIFTTFNTYSYCNIGAKSAQKELIRWVEKGFSHSPCPESYSCQRKTLWNAFYLVFLYLSN